MRTAGIIAEYNPFHEGHRYHIEETRRKGRADYVIAVMSGDYVQRGEPAIVDKYLRTEMALRGGADAVIELPCAYATASAEQFALAGVRLLDSLGVVDLLSFGSEWAGAGDYEALADILCQEPEEYKEKLKEGLRQGLSFPAARQEALSGLFPGKEESIRRFLRQPNHILGLEYMKALRKEKSLMEPLIIRRDGSSYHESEIHGSHSSATAVRKQLMQYHNPGRSEVSEEDDETDHGLKMALGDNYELFLSRFDRGDYVTWDDLMPFLRYTFLYKGNVVGKYFGMDADLARRIRKQYRQELSWSQLVDALHARNRTDTAVKRALLHVVLQMKYAPWLEEGKVLIPCARVLGFRKEAAPLLKKIRECARIPVIQKPSIINKTFMRHSPEMQLMDYDIRGADLYEQIAAGKSSRPPVAELRKIQVIL